MWDHVEGFDKNILHGRHDHISRHKGLRKARRDILSMLVSHTVFLSQCFVHASATLIVFLTLT